MATVPVVPQVSPSVNSDDEERSMRTQVFEKTKMCKFHILGACAKGSICRFAHFPSELNNLPDLACTKLCKALIATGLCDNPECRYAHSQEELRPMPFGQVYGVAEREKEKGPRAPFSAGALIQPVGQVVTMAPRNPAPTPAMHMQKALLQQPMMGQENGYRTDFSHWDTLAQEDAASVASDGYRQLGLLGVRSATPPRIPKVSSAAARLCTMGQDPEEQPAEALRMLSANEPVQINLQSLRSLSGSNLVAMAEDTNGVDYDWLPPLMHSRHNSLELRENSLAKSSPLAPMIIPPVASGLSPILGETTEEANMPTTTVEQFWQARDGESHFSDYTSKLAPNQWMDQTYLGDDVKPYPSWPKGFENMDSFYSDSGLCTVASRC